MNPGGFNPCRCLALLGLLALMAGCAVAPEVRDTQPEQVTRAQQAGIAGRYAEAAMLWEDAAGASQGGQKQTYLLRAAEAWSAAGMRPETRAVLGSIAERELGATDMSRYALLQAEDALADADAEKADFYLRIAHGSLPANQQARFRDLRSRVEQLRVNPGAYALATASSVLAEMGGYETGKGVALLQLLEDVPSGTLEQTVAGRAADPGLGDWPALALRMRQALLAGPDLRVAAADWAFAHPGHVVSEAEFLALGAHYRQMFSAPSRVAVLLPMEGGLAAASAAIRDGLISAFLENPQGSSLRFYATGTEPESAVSAYFQAMGEGAQWIIGPLRREAVQALARLGSLSAPVLALNSVMESDPAAADNLLFSLSLSQDEEARSIARKLLETGRMRVMSLTSDSAWGNRVETEFADELVAGEGEIVATASFAPADNDHSNMLTDLLKIKESEDRKNRLQATIGVPLEFEPTRRDDFDVIFLAANPEQGRQIRPQLRFHDAGDKDVIAMSRIYDGKPNPSADQDLNGIVFPATVWELATVQDAPRPGLRSLRGGSMGKLYALGFDAWNLVSWLPLMAKDPDLVFPGAIGQLKVAAGGQLSREPAWAVFSRGHPIPAEWSQQDD